MRTYWLFLMPALAVISLTFPVLAVAVATVLLAAAGAVWVAHHLRRWWGNVVLFALLAMACTGMYPSPGWAQEAASTKVSLAPIAELLGLAAVGIAGLMATFAGMALQRFSAWSGIKIADTQSQAVLAAARRGVFFGLGKVEDLIGGAAIDVKSTVVAEAINYVLGKVPGHVKALGLSNKDIGDIAAAMLLEVQSGTSKGSVLTPAPVSA